jgi:hypothetical protein
VLLLVVCSLQTGLETDAFVGIVFWTCKVET